MKKDGPTWNGNDKKAQATRYEFGRAKALNLQPTCLDPFISKSIRFAEISESGCIIHTDS